MAAGLLAEQQMTLGEIGYQLAPETLEQTIIRQDPLPGALIANGTTVKIVMAVTGPPPDRSDLVAIPRLSDLTVSQADENLKLAGLLLKLDGTTTTDRPHRITTQAPEPGRFVTIGTQVTAFVEPIDKVIVPDLVGIDETSVDTALTETFLIGGERAWALSTKPEGTVIDQAPSAGTEVAFGVPVDVTLSASSLIPDLSDVTPEEATRILADQSLQLGEVEEVFSLGLPGTIVAQIPEADTPAGTDSVVKVQVVGLMGPLTAGGLFLIALASIVWFKTRQAGQAGASLPSAQPPPVYGIAKSAAQRPAFNRTAKAARPAAEPAAPAEPHYVVELDPGNQVIQTDAPNLVKPSIRLRGRADPGSRNLPSNRHDRGGPSTLREFFLGPPSEWQARFIKTAESQQSASGIGRATGIGDVDRRVMTNNVADKLKDALDVQINQILKSAWSQHRDLLDDLEKSRQARGETFLVPLANHTIRSTHHPAVEVLVNDRRVAAFKFNANLVMRIQEAVLKVEDGNVVGVESGVWQGVGQLKCGAVTLVEHETEEFALPASLIQRPAKPQPASSQPASPKPAGQQPTGQQPASQAPRQRQPNLPPKPKPKAKVGREGQAAQHIPHWQRPR